MASAAAKTTPSRAKMTINMVNPAWSGDSTCDDSCVLLKFVLLLSVPLAGMISGTSSSTSTGSSSTTGSANCVDSISDIRPSFEFSLLMNQIKSAYSTLETFNQKLNPEFEFLTPEFTFIEPNKDFKYFWKL